MKCGETKKELYFYIKDELETGKKTEIENHLKECSACRSLLGGFSKTLETVDKNPVSYPGKNWNYFASEILSGVYEKKKFIFWKPALVFALSFFVFAAGYIYYHQKKLQENVASSDTEKLVTYLSNFDIPELYQ
ncbi:MAG: zf-HC2 domain-containing protein [Elusimicrobia bacterium]|nr:zf-HC2 domain-containing protein [Elusimicrobiota bacterium]